jgi:two-component system NtrC family sensor kinase
VSSATILIVEDSETQALALRRMLETHGYAVEVAASGEAALERLNDHLPDLVVADFHLPGMDGRELSRQIRLNNRTRALPLLMLTSAREQDLERQGLESGVDAYVPKSGDTDLLLVRLQSLLRRAAAAAAPADAQGGFRRARILLTNPSPTIRLRLRRLLEQEGYEVLEPADPAAVLRMADRSVDGIVLPLIGPDLEGLELCERLRARREALPADFQIVAIGPGADEPEKLARAFAAGADEVASREDGEDVLRVRIRALMRRKMIIEDNRRAQEAEARAAAADELAAANRQLREAQAQLIQSAKMASLGELVAGIAHEINNPLAFILGHQDTVERLVRETAARREADAPPDPMLQKALDRLASMRLGLQRIQGLVLNLRKFSRLDQADRQRLDVADAIDTVLALLSPKLGGIEVRRLYEARGALEGSPALLNQVVMNIVSNAADALGGAGVIAVATSDAEGAYRITIDDSGPGVPPDLRDRIFEPFFTTKAVGEGTGLGLAIAYSVVKAHDGDIAVDASPELGGARFTLTLPQREA